MPYICLDETDIVQTGDKVIFTPGEDRYICEINIYEYGCRPGKPAKDLFEIPDVVAVLRWEDPKTRCLDENEQLCADDVLIFQDGEHLKIHPDGKIAGMLVKDLLERVSPDFVVAVLRSTENEK
jgi:hypothetical protein